jgi:biopolymer transport protein ExbB/TolQ
MIQTFPPRFPNRRQIVTIALAVGTAVGWGVFAVSSYSAANAERQLRQQVADLQAGQSLLQSERNQLQRADVEVAQLRKQLSLAQDETARLVQEKVSAQPKLPTAQSLLHVNSSAARQSRTIVSQTNSITSTPPTPPRAPARSMRTALAKPGPGLLVAESGSGDGKR